jgi:RNA polymerase sigma-70 factor (ECF subfamily)
MTTSAQFDGIGRDSLINGLQAHRARLRGVAYRILGSSADADDAIQEAWIRLHRSDPGSVANLEAYLTTVVARISLDMLRSRRARPDAPAAGDLPERASVADTADAADPAESAMLADAVGVALLAVLDSLPPAQRVAFVLHDLFDLPFDEIAPVVGRSEAATRQLASRARRRVRGAPPPARDLVRQRKIVEAFLAASRGGDFAGLLAVLDPEVVLRADAAAIATGAPSELRGAEAVAGQFVGRARAARVAVLDGSAGLIWMRGPEPAMAFRFVIAPVATDAATERSPEPASTDGDWVVTGIEMIADPERLAALDWEFG